MRWMVTMLNLEKFHKWYEDNSDLIEGESNYKSSKWAWTEATKTARYEKSNLTLDEIFAIIDECSCNALNSYVKILNVETLKSKLTENAKGKAVIPELANMIKKINGKRI